MEQPKLKYLYGPVPSWRLGSSLGIDPISCDDKVCNFNCVYCQLGPTVHFSCERKVFVPTADLIREFQLLPPVPIDFLTFSGRGEPTLAKNLGEMIRAVRQIRPERIAVITNAGLIERLDVQEDLALADFVLAKLDACSQETLEQISRPVREIYYEHILEGIRTFRQRFKGRLSLQLMFMSLNQDCAAKMAEVVRTIGADEIEINTPLRPSSVKPLDAPALEKIKSYFAGLPVKTVYELQGRDVEPIDLSAAVKRHGEYR